MNRRLLNIILIVPMIITILTGCSNEVVEQKANVVTVELSWWGNDARHKYTMDGVNEFAIANPDIDVKYRYGEWSGYERKNRVWMESTTEADVMQINYAWLSEYSANGDGYYDLSLLTDYIDLSSFDESDLEYGMVNGKLNAIPIAFNTSTLCYNKAIFDKYNLEYPKTWDDLFTAAEVLSKDDIYVLGTANKHMLLMLIAYYEQTKGEKVFSEDGKLLIDKEGIAYMLDFYKELIDKKVLIPVEQFDRSAFANGKVAMSFFWVSDADNYCGALKDNGGEPVISNYLMADNAKLSGLYMKPATMYAISGITEHPEESAKLLNYLINDEKMAIYQGTEKGVPVSKKAFAALENEGKLDGYGYKAYDNMHNNKEKLSIMLPVMESEAVIGAFKSNADAYIYDVAGREETIDKIYEDILNVINK